ncbi:hypothetical protein [Rickettsia endosymbiont of Oedothorax gibbosus]|nr:hypothetical protein [Rickettsia endosymbiont of Oedothorax gibbosus]
MPLAVIVNSGEFGARSDGATLIRIGERRATTSPTSHQLTIAISGK